MVAMVEPKPLRRVLIIDDDPAFVDTLSAMVLSLGFPVTISVEGGSDHILDLTDDDIVFLDVLMPISSGLQVLDQLAEQQATCAIVLMSGSLERLDGAEKYAESLDLNLIGALEKPFRLDDVKDVLSVA